MHRVIRGWCCPPHRAWELIKCRFKSSSECVEFACSVCVCVGFLARLHYFSSPLPARPYSLSINAEDYHYAPKPKHLRPARLLRILGPSFDPFWMSIERPAEAAGVSAARYQRKLEKEAEDVDLSVLPRDVAAAVRAWLVRSATCALRYKWVDLGPVFWPRWLRHTDCDQPGRVQSCSFPAGMACRPGVADLGLAMYGKRCVWRQVPYPVVTACKCSCK
uniref:Noggin n=1 Tax=Scleropages formosus TaxID=113540 RepID=A0A8C9WFJ3_SCLFO